MARLPSGDQLVANPRPLTPTDTPVPTPTATQTPPDCFGVISATAIEDGASTQGCGTTTASPTPTQTPYPTETPCAYDVINLEWPMLNYDEYSIHSERSTSNEN